MVEINKKFFEQFVLGSDLREACEEAYKLGAWTAQHSVGVLEVLIALFDRHLRRPFSLDIDHLQRHVSLTSSELEKLKSSQRRIAQKAPAFRASRSLVDVMTIARSLTDQARGEKAVMEVDDFILGLAEQARQDSGLLKEVKVLRLHQGLLSEIPKVHQFRERQSSQTGSDPSELQSSAPPSLTDPPLEGEPAPMPAGAPADPPADSPPGAPPPRPEVGGGQDFRREASEEQLGLKVNEYASIIAQMFYQTQDEFCFAVYGRWGRGKSKLSERTAAELRKLQSVETIRFSAWQYPTQPEVWVHLYERFAEAAFGGSWWDRFPTIVRAGVERHGAHRLLGALLFFVLAFVPLTNKAVLTWKVFLFSLSTLGVTGLLLLYSAVQAIRSTSNRLTRDYLIGTRHTEKLGLQAVIGKDLRILLKGWTGKVSFGFFFYGMYVALTLLWAGILAMRINGDQALVDHIHDWTGIELVSRGGPLTAAIVALIATTISISLFCWILFGGRSPQKVLLVVDDLDRCRPEHLLSVVESIKLLLEDKGVNATVQVMMLLEEEILKHAIVEKYYRLIESPVLSREGTTYDIERLFRENCEKLFTAHLRLPQLTKAEIKQLLEKFSGYENRLQKLKDAAQSLEDTIDQEVARDAPLRDEVVIRPEHKVNFYRRSEFVPKVARPLTEEEERAQREARANREAEAAPARAEVRSLQEQIMEMQGEELSSPAAAAHQTKDVLEPIEINAILRAVLGDSFIGRENLGPRGIRAFILRYQLARMIMNKLGLAWSPDDLAQALAKRHSLRAGTKSPAAPSHEESYDANIARVADQVS